MYKFLKRTADIILSILAMIMLAVLLHGAELDHCEFFSVQSETLLTEKDRSGIFNIDGKTGKQNQPPETKKNETAAQNITDSFYKISIHLSPLHPNVIQPLYLRIR